MHIIELDPAETFYSLRDRILRGERGRIVLVLPPRGDALRRGVDLVLLRRFADRERLEVGLVTEDRALARQARALGLPAFSSLVLAEHYRPGWWRGRRRSERLGSPSDERRATSDELRSEDRWVAAVAVTTVVLVSLLLVSAAIFTLPQATITLRPATQPAQVITELTADPALAGPDAAALGVPAQVVSVPATWEVTDPSTGNAAADRRRLGSAARQALEEAAPELLSARLDPGQLLAPDSVTLGAGEERLTMDGDTARLTLAAEVEGLAVAAADVYSLVYPQLSAALPDGYAPQATTLAMQVEPAASGAPARFQVTARAEGWVGVDTAALAAALRGRRAADVARFLTDAIPLAEPPTLDVGPSWWWSWLGGRLPLWTQRIDVQVLP